MADNAPEENDDGRVSKCEQPSAATSSTTSARASKNSRRFQILESQGFIVGKTLGNGSYATVRSAYDVNRKHKVALKIISKRKAPDDYLSKFLPREIEAIKVLKHPSLIAFYQVIETTTRYFLVMELGHVDLLDTIRRKKFIEEDQSGAWFHQLHDGLYYMHSKSLVHRDLKCENILLDFQNNLKITDFGFAKKIVKTKTGDVKYSETYCGSYAYAPPEILRGTPYDPYLADVWSLGVVLFTMLYGRLPFDDSNHKKLLKQVQNRVAFPSKPDVTEGARILILKMLTKLSDRIPLGNIRYDPWFKKNVSASEPNQDLCHESPGMAELVIKQPLPTIASGTSKPEEEAATPAPVATLVTTNDGRVQSEVQATPAIEPRMML